MARAAGYALVAYQTAYLKAKYPVEFLAASMNLDMRNTDKLAVFRQELRRLDIPLFPPDVNRSMPDFTVECSSKGTLSIRYALGAIKGVSPTAMSAVASERIANGKFDDLGDLAERLDSKVVNKRQVEQLAAAGALDTLNANRGQSFSAAELLLRYTQSARSERESGQISLFSKHGHTSGENQLRLPVVEDWDTAERLSRELASIGFYFSAHPLDGYAKNLARLNVIPSIDLTKTIKAAKGTSILKVAGALLSKSERRARNGSKIAFVQLTDTSGSFEVLMFSEILAHASSLMKDGRPLLVHVNARIEEEQVKLQAIKVEDLELAAAVAGRGFRIWVGEVATVGSISDLMKRQAWAGNGGGGGRMSLIVSTSTEEIEFALPNRYPCTPRVRDELRAIPGVKEVQEL